MSIDKYIVFLLFFSLFLSIHTREFDNNSSYGWDRSDNYSYARLQFSNTDNHSEDISNVRYGIRTSYADQLHRNQYHTFKHVRTGYTETISQQEWVNFICKQVDLPFFSEKSIKENCANLSIVQQCKILKLHAYYELPNFFAVVQQLPHYVDYITSLYNTYKNKWRIRQIVEYYTGQVPPNLEKLNESALFIKANKEREYAAQQKKYACLKQEEQKKECEQKIRFDHLQNSQLNKKESLAQLSDDYYDDLYGYDENDNYHDCDNFNFKTEEYKKRIELRHDALRVSLDTDFAITNKEYALSDNANKILHNFSVQSQAFLTCEGSTYQQVIHTELISILDQLGDQYVVVQTNELLRIITKNTIDFVTVAQECNSAAQVKKATCAADVGWALLDYSKAVIQGVAQGAVATVNSVLHPIETMNAIVQSIKTVSYHMAVFIAEVIEINQAIEMHDFEAMHAKSTALHKRIESNIEFVCDVVRETPGPDLVRKTVAFATEAYLTGKVIGACGKVFTHAKIKILPAF